MSIVVKHLPSTSSRFFPSRRIHRSTQEEPLDNQVKWLSKKFTIAPVLSSLISRVSASSNKRLERLYWWYRKPWCQPVIALHSLKLNRVNRFEIRSMIFTRNHGQSYGAPQGKLTSAVGTQLIRICAQWGVRIRKLVTGWTKIKYSMCFKFHRGAPFERLRNRIAPKDRSGWHRNQSLSLLISVHIFRSIFRSYGVEH